MKGMTRKSGSTACWIRIVPAGRHQRPKGTLQQNRSAGEVDPGADDVPSILESPINHVLRRAQFTLTTSRITSRLAEPEGDVRAGRYSCG